MKEDKQPQDEELQVEGTAEEVTGQAEETAGEEKTAGQIDYPAELAKHKDAYLRLFAEFDNYKKRTAREKADWIKLASSGVMEALLPVLDDFERGLVQAEAAGDAVNAEGFKLIYNKLSETLKQKGLVAVETKKGDDFDVDIHDAIARIPAGDEALKGKIVDVTQKGYKIGDRIIRYAKVVIGE